MPTSSAASRETDRVPLSQSKITNFTVPACQLDENVNVSNGTQRYHTVPQNQSQSLTITGEYNTTCKIMRWMVHVMKSCASSESNGEG